MKAKFLVGAVLIAALIIFSRHVYTKRQEFRSDMDRIQQGMSLKEVIAILGMPRRFQKPCYAPRPRCEEDLVYTSPLDFGNYWAISLDQSGHVIDKFYWRSP